MTNIPPREEFRCESAFQGLQRLVGVRANLSMATEIRERDLNSKEEIEVGMWSLLALDPLVEAYDKLSPEVKAGFPPLPPLEATYVLKGDTAQCMEKLQRVISLFLRNEEVVIQVLKEI